MGFKLGGGKKRKVQTGITATVPDYLVKIIDSEKKYKSRSQFLRSEINTFLSEQKEIAQDVGEFVIIGVALPPDLIMRMNRLIKEGQFKSRSEILRLIFRNKALEIVRKNKIQEKVKKEKREKIKIQKQNPNKLQIGDITYNVRPTKS